MDTGPETSNPGALVGYHRLGIRGRLRHPVDRPGVFSFQIGGMVMEFLLGLLVGIGFMLNLKSERESRRKELELRLKAHQYLSSLKTPSTSL